ncbi:probable phospholipid hydroperoxide glutathione peroxidase [Contarinia nasturtii]|uniref:probable phospholipid hydroperoxide glutathione peroxidase n=1 Tax=Contarinia nasturtii TaxID=265458 RepID=UPI0012D3D3F3|nr:probable phospholipid hydroperoxide glutathione peroxidase [Contarinia nasturtii]
MNFRNFQLDWNDHLSKTTKSSNMICKSLFGFLLCACVLAKASLGAYVSDLKSNTDCKALLGQKADERVKNPDLANQITTSNMDYTMATSIFDFTIKDTYDMDVPLADYCRRYVTLIVNIASSCGLTKANYAQLTELNMQFNDKLRILLFPSNQFNGQMPEGDGDEMLCHLKMKNAAPGRIFAKVDVNGDKAHPLYKYLKNKLKGEKGADIEWNFVKFLIDKNGMPVKRYDMMTEPMTLVEDIKMLF